MKTLYKTQRISTSWKYATLELLSADTQEKVGSIQLTNLFSSAVITAPTAQLEVSAKINGTDIQIEGQRKGKFRYRWKGSQILEWNDHSYEICFRGFLKGQFYVLDENKREILRIVPRLELLKGYQYLLEGDQGLDPTLVLLLLYGAHTMLGTFYVMRGMPLAV